MTNVNPPNVTKTATELPPGQLGEAPNLRGRMRRGGAIFVVGYGVRQFLRLGSNLILTRLLMPEAFGVMAAAISINMLAAMISDIGIEKSVVRSKFANDASYLRTAWTLRIFRNILVFLIVALIAGITAFLAGAGVSPPGSVFADPILPLFILVSGTQILIQAGGTMNQFMAERRIEAGRTITLELISQLIGAGLTIALAFAGFGVWSLAAGMLASTAVTAGLGYLLFPGPAMGFDLSRAHVSEILHFGKWLLLASFFGFITNRGDQLIFGWAFDDAAFGLYAVAAIWITAGMMFFEIIIRRVFFPAYSEILRDRPGEMAAAYQKSRLIMDAAVVAASFCIFFLADLAVQIVYPENFQGVAGYLKLLTPIIILFPYKLLYNVVLANGDSKTFTAITFVTGIVTLVGTPLAIVLLGAKAGIIFFACIRLAAAPVAMMVARKIMTLNMLTELRILAPAALLVFLLVRMDF